MDLANKDYLDFTESANNNQLVYLIIGGMALYLNGIRRHTEDVDIWLEPTQENGKRFYQTLLGIGFTAEELEQIEELDFTQPQVFGILGTLDILTRVHYKLDFWECYKRSKVYKDERGIEIHFLHLNDLREAKVLARREQDLRDIIMIDDFKKQNSIN